MHRGSEGIRGGRAFARLTGRRQNVTWMGNIRLINSRTDETKLECRRKQRILWKQSRGTGMPASMHRGYEAAGADRTFGRLTRRRQNVTWMGTIRLINSRTDETKLECHRKQRSLWKQSRGTGMPASMHRIYQATGGGRTFGRRNRPRQCVAWGRERADSVNFKIDGTKLECLRKQRTAVESIPRSLYVIVNKDSYL